jgi:hypothetical protein
MWPTLFQARADDGAARTIIRLIAMSMQLRMMTLRIAIVILGYGEERFDE